MKRWIILLACILIQTCLGVVYAWSTFVPALELEHGVHPGLSGFIFGLSIAVFTFSMIFAGRLQARFGPRPVCLIGGTLFLAGYLLGSFSNGAYPLLVTGFGLVAGVGIGFGYVCPLSTGIQWFPEHKGLVTGLTVAGFGLGSVFFARAAMHLLEQEVPVLSIMRGIGLTAGGLVLLSAPVLSIPKRPIPLPDAPSIPVRIHPLNSPDLRLLFLLIFCGTFGGLAVIGNLKPIGISIGLSPARATLAVMLFAVANAAGRILWGAGYDRIGSPMIRRCLLLLAIGAIVLALGRNPAGFYLATLLIGFAFGGCFVLFAAQVADLFGSDRIGELYPFVFLGYGIAGLVGPSFGGWLLHQSGSPLLPAVAVLASAGLGTLLAWRFLTCSRSAANRPG